MGGELTTWVAIADRWPTDEELAAADSAFFVWGPGYETATIADFYENPPGVRGFCTDCGALIEVTHYAPVLLPAPPGEGRTTMLAPMTEALAIKVLGFPDGSEASFRHGDGDVMSGNLGDVLSGLGWTFGWLQPGLANLSGNFTPEMLEAIAWWMRNKKVTT